MSNLFLEEIDEIKERAINPEGRFDKIAHDSKSRLEITKLFLKWYFCLIGGGFLFCLIYNFLAAYLNYKLKLDTPLKYLDISNTVSLITNTLTGGMGFVIGYYFKNKD
jgi:hypothetical protein